MFFFWLLVIIVAGVVVWRLRVPILAKLLGQDPNRVRHLNERRKD
jgi:hypothetical protein